MAYMMNSYSYKHGLHDELIHSPLIAETHHYLGLCEVNTGSENDIGMNISRMKCIYYVDSLLMLVSMYISAHLMYVPCNLTMELSSTLDTVISTDHGTFIKVAHLLMEKLCSHT